MDGDGGRGEARRVRGHGDLARAAVRAGRGRRGGGVPGEPGGAGSSGRLCARVCMYLVVDMSGSLVVVQREYSVRRDAVEVEVEVSRFAAEERKWEAVEELAAGEALFVGSVVSVAARATEGSGIRGNCVYMARREVELIAPHAIGVYSLADGEADGLAISGGHSLAAEPVWIAPSLA